MEVQRVFMSREMGGLGDGRARLAGKRGSILKNEGVSGLRKAGMGVWGIRGSRKRGAGG